MRTLADRILDNVKSTRITQRGEAFEYFYYELKKMVTEPDLLVKGELTYFNRMGLKGQKFKNGGNHTRWYVYTTFGSQRSEIVLTLVR